MLIKGAHLTRLISFFMLYLILSLAMADDNNSNWNLILPVSQSPDNKQKINLLVKVPKTYKTIGNDPVQNNPSALLEFIPEQDKNAEDWSRIITVKSFIGITLKSNKEYLDTIVNDLKTNVKNPVVIEGDDKKQEGYEEGYRIVSYNYNNRDEILYIYTASGSFDTAMVQYAIKLNSPEDLEKAKTELKTFMKDNVTIATQ